MKEYYDVCIIGGGPGGLGAAAGAVSLGASVALFERNAVTGGVLSQCIHDGFGLYRYGAALSGPEYARYALEEAEGAEIFTGCTVTGLSDRELTVVSPAGLNRVRAGAIVMATGCRERTREAIMIPGTRPAGIFTAGTAQELMNLRGRAIGKRAVVLGSGDIGLIAARRMKLRGMEVAAICEARDEPSGLTRNVVQCARDFGIPILTGTTVTEVFGKGRVSAVEISNRRGEKQVIECDTLILSVGLIPERELIPGGEAEGIFLCGNCKRIEQLADLATVSGENAGKAAAAAALGIVPEGEVSAPELPVLPTGFPEDGATVCTGCPRGCTVKTESDGRVTGNFCPRGEELAKNPERYLTLTVKTPEGKSVSLRSARPIPVRCHLSAAEELKSQKTEDPAVGRLSGLFARGVPMIITGISPY